MTFDAQETSVESGQPIELYWFTLDSENFRYTSNQEDVTVDSFEYDAIPISRGEILMVPNDPSSERLSVTLPADDPFVQNFVTVAPSVPAVLTISRIHRNDGAEEVVTIFQGTVLNVSFTRENREAVAQVVPKTHAATRTIPRFNFSGQCNHVLYDARCKILIDDPTYRHEGEVTAVNGNVITVDGAAAFNVLTDFFVAGIARFGDETRMITAQSGDDLTLVLPFATSPLGQDIFVNAGCKQRFQTDCISKFNNRENFGGFPHVPTKNPFETGIE